MYFFRWFWRSTLADLAPVCHSWAKVSLIIPACVCCTLHTRCPLLIPKRYLIVSFYNVTISWNCGFLFLYFFTLKKCEWKTNYLPFAWKLTSMIAFKDYYLSHSTTVRETFDVPNRSRIQAACILFMNPVTRYQVLISQFAGNSMSKSDVFRFEKSSQDLGSSLRCCHFFLYFKWMHA